MVPTEIVDHVLSFVRSDEDYTTLETCSDVFPHLVDRHLYSRITFTEYPSPPKRTFRGEYLILDADQFALTLLSRPHVANDVRFVRIMIRTGVALSVISSILSKLSQITSIAFSGGENLSWDMLDASFRLAFQNTLRLPSINEVAVARIQSFPMNILDCCENLKHLRLLGRCTGGEAVSMSFYPPLSSLDISYQTDVAITKVVSWMKANTLRSLSLRVDNWDLSQFRTLIEACSPTLVNLELQLSTSLLAGHDTGIFPPLRIQLPFLKQIIIRSAVIVLSPKPLSSLPVFAPILSSIPKTHPIRLCLQLIFLDLETRDIDWSDLASFLVLHVFWDPIELDVLSAQASLADIVSSFKEHSVLKRLHETGKLVIKFIARI